MNESPSGLSITLEFASKEPPMYAAFLTLGVLLITIWDIPVIPGSTDCIPLIEFVLQAVERENLFDIVKAADCDFKEKRVNLSNWSV